MNNVIVVFSAGTEYELNYVLYCELKEGSKGESDFILGLLQYKYPFSFYMDMRFFKHGFNKVKKKSS